ncbi:MAG TPA: TolC family protein [Bryobacteraceae bacterium]|nr:TolC family protein [Bryobacteraceae bacterium]
MRFNVLPVLALLAFCGYMPEPASPQTISSENLFSHDYSHTPRWFPNFVEPYQAPRLLPPVLENSPRLKDLIHDGKLELSLSDALALALENNLDIAVQRYLRPIAQTDVLRASSGQAARGIPGATLPSGLNTGAIGAGVNAAGGNAGVGAAGGITGGGGAIQVGQVGTFDPSLNFNMSFDRNVSPLNTSVVAGVPTVTTDSFAGSINYAQMLPEGTSYFTGISVIRQLTTQQHLQFNPAFITRFTSGFNQPLLNGRGFGPNMRFVYVAQNDLKTSEQIFKLQVTNTIVQVEDAYWNLAASKEAVRVAQESLTAANALSENNQKKLAAGVAAQLDVTTAQAQVAASQRDLVVAQTNLQQAETQLKNMLSKKTDPALDAAEVDTTDPLPEPQAQDVPLLQDALQSALTRRPDLLQAENDLENQHIATRFTRNAVLPQLSTFGLYAGSGLQGNSLLSLLGSEGGAGSLGQAFGAAFPEYGAGASYFMYLGNRSALADSMRSQLETNQSQVNLQRSRQQIDLEVRQAITGLVQGQSQVQAAHRAADLARRVLDAEQKKLDAGISTPYDIVLRTRDLVTAEQADIAAITGYARALVEMDRATGTILEKDGIDLQDAHLGTVTHQPAPPFRIPRLTGAAQPVRR